MKEHLKHKWFLFLSKDFVVAVNGVWILVETYISNSKPSSGTVWYLCLCVFALCPFLYVTGFLCSVGVFTLSQKVPWSYIVFLTSKSEDSFKGVLFQ